MLSQKSLEMIAKACHEANKAICDFNNESMDSWDDAKQWQRDAAIQGVKDLIDNPNLTPESLHIKWMENKEKDGWEYGTIKDADKKTHPCMIPYDQLPEYQQLKDHVFHSIVKSFITK